MTLQRGAPIARRGSFAPATRATVPLRPTMRSVRFPRQGWVFFSRREAARCPHFASASFSANKIRYGTGIPRGNSRVGEFGSAGRPQLRCLGAPEPHARPDGRAWGSGAPRHQPMLPDPHACPALRAAHPFARRSAALPAAIDALGARSPLPARLPQGSRRSQSRGPEASARLLEAEVTRGGTGGLSLGGGFRAAEGPRGAGRGWGRPRACRCHGDAAAWPGAGPEGEVGPWGRILLPQSGRGLFSLRLAWKSRGLKVNYQLLVYGLVVLSQCFLLKELVMVSLLIGVSWMFLL